MPITGGGGGGIQIEIEAIDRASAQIKKIADEFNHLSRGFTGDFLAGLQRGSAGMDNFGAVLLKAAQNADLSTRELEHLTKSSGLFTDQQMLAARAQELVAKKAEELAKAVAEGAMSADHAGREFKKYAEELQVVEKESKKTSSTMGDVAKAIVVANQAMELSSRTGFTQFLQEIVSLAAESETVMTRLNTTLIASGRDGEITAEKLEKIAGHLQNMSAFDDESILSAYNAIAKFESIDTGSMDAIVRSAMDMSAALGGDLASNAEAIGRVLETGVIPRAWAFDAALKEQIKTMVETGDSAGALALMLDELSKRYGGQAAAQVNTYAGATAALKNQFDQMKESIGGSFLPSLTKAITAVSQFYSIMNSLGDFGGGMKWQQLIPIYGQIDLIVRDIAAYKKIMNGESVASIAAEKELLRIYKEQQDARGTPRNPEVGILQGIEAITNGYTAMAYAYNDAEGALSGGGIMDEAAILAAADAMKVLAEAQNVVRQGIIDRTTWEVAYTGAKDAATQAEQALTLLGDQMQGMGTEGATVWNEFLVATGQISKEADTQFQKVARIVATAKMMLSGGVPINVVVNFMTQQAAAAGLITGGGGGGAGNGVWQPAGIVGGADTRPVYVNPATGEYSLSNTQYVPIGGHASGGAFSGWAMVGDLPGGGKTPQTEYVYAPHGAVVYNQSQMSGRSSPPSAASGGLIPAAVTSAANGADNDAAFREFARYIVEELRRTMG